MTVHCPLCGLRFRLATELDQHARDEHAPPVVETKETVTVPKVRRAGDVETPWDRVLARRAARER